MSGEKEDRTFVLKDNEGNYVGSNSISCRNKKTQHYVYSYSKFYTNGFYTYQSESSAQEALKIIQDKETEINIGKQFHFEEIDRLKVLRLESTMNVPKNPFIHRNFIMGLVID